MLKPELIFPVLIFLLVSFVPGIHAQQNFQLGIRGGLNQSDVKTILPATILASAKTSFHIGIFGRKQFTKKSSLETGLFYSGKGVVLMSLFQSENIKVNFNYITLPCFYQYHIKNLLLEGGLFASYHFSYKTRFKTTSAHLAMMELQRSNFECGLNLGIAYRIKKVTIGIRYQRSFQKLIGNYVVIDPESERINQGNFVFDSVLQFSAAVVLFQTEQE